MNSYEWGVAEWFAVVCLFIVVVGLIAHAIRPRELPSPLVTGGNPAHMPLDGPRSRSNGLNCHVVWCGKPHTKRVHGWLLCDEHYEEKVTTR